MRLKIEHKKKETDQCNHFGQPGPYWGTRRCLVCNFLPAIIVISSTSMFNKTFKEEECASCWSLASEHIHLIDASGIIPHSGKWPFLLHFVVVSSAEDGIQIVGKNHFSIITVFSFCWRYVHSTNGPQSQTWIGGRWRRKS